MKTVTIYVLWGGRFTKCPKSNDSSAYLMMCGDRACAVQKDKLVVVPPMENAQTLLDMSWEHGMKNSDKSADLTIWEFRGCAVQKDKASTSPHCTLKTNKIILKSILYCW